MGGEPSIPALIAGAKAVTIALLVLAGWRGQHVGRAVQVLLVLVLQPLQVLVSLISIAASFLGADTYGIIVRVLTNNRDNVTSCFLRLFMVNNIFADISMTEILVHQIFSNFSWRKITVHF